MYLSLLTISFWVLIRADENLVDYYEDLIKLEIARAKTYRAPNDAGAHRPSDNKLKDYGFYDFVVVGAGAAGAVVASRLSENSSRSVLLLEAGQQGNDLTDIPAMNSVTTASEYDWGFKSVPQTECCQANGGLCPFTKGKSLGGTTVINAQIYARGTKADYDKWASLVNPDWSYDKVLPYFIESENMQAEGDLGYHGFDGYLNVEHHCPTSRKVEVFLAAHRELGRPTIDVNGKHITGASYTYFNTLNGRRLSTDKAFLEPARLRPNLKILTRSYVEKVLINEDSKTVIGIIFSSNSTRYFVSVTGEVILSAGVVGSPHILIHSGVGPGKLLKDLNIKVLSDLQVGYNMHDHVAFSALKFSTQIPDTIYPLREAIKQYLNGAGPLTIPYNLQGISFIQLSPDNSTAPDFELLLSPFMNKFDAKEFASKSYVSYLQLALLHPKTRGRIHPKSNDPYIYPLIDSKCFGDERNEDVAQLRLGIEKVLEMFETKAFKEVGAELLPHRFCDEHEFKSDGYWACCIRMYATNLFHSAGTCSMGAVVDGELRVHGVRGLRVADASVIPVTISGHMSAPSVMIGERVADFIKINQNART